MNRQKRKTGKSSAKEESRHTEAETAENRLESLLKVALVVLLLSRFFVPAENAADGETLLWVCLTFGIVTLWVWDGMKAGSVGFSLTRFDLAFLAIVFAHVISGLAVVFTEGQKRAALNMVWEWLGLGVTLFLLRQFVVDTRFYKQLLLATISVVVALAALGIYQHFVWYPYESETYLTLRKELDELEARSKTSSNPRTENRIRQIQTDFVTGGIPLEGPGRKRFENRLVSSREPFGMFALANTFAGVLTVGFLMVFGNLISITGKEKILKDRFPLFIAILLIGYCLLKSLKDRIPFLIAMLLIGYCLYLTKSRTAWVGTFCGAAFLVWMIFRTRFLSKKFSKLAEICVITFIGISVLVVGAIVASGPDAKVMKEAPRSLSFRFQYWQGTRGVISEAPFFGVGPGNFRQHYLKHKLPESSEEILDPHNFIFDLWANSGILAVLGIAVAIFYATRSAGRFFKQDERRGEEFSTNQKEKSQFPVVLLGTILSLLVFLWESNFDMGPNLGVSAIAFVTFLFLSRIPEDTVLNTAILSGCCIAMLVHLLGAGGIEMPTVVIVLLIFSVGFTRKTDSETDFHFEFRSGKKIVTALVVCFLLTLGCFFTGFSPTFQVKSLMVLARSAAVDGDIPAAEADYRKAAEVDPLSPKPWVDLSILLYRQSLVGDSQNEKFAEAVRLQKLAIDRDPHSWQGYRMLGVWFSKHYRKSRSRKSLNSAVENYDKAVVRYPTNSQLHAEFAIFLSKAKLTDKARKHARQALILHAIDREEGHTDKYLPDDELAKLTKIVEE